MTDLIRPVPGALTQDFDGAYPAERPGYLNTSSVPHRGKRTPFTGGKWRRDLHLGIDYSAAVGTKVKAMAAGRIVAQGMDTSSGNAWFVQQRIRRSEKFDLYLLYYHLKASGLLHAIGAVVAQGTPIALSGNTGWSTAPHLHITGVVRLPRGTSPGQWFAGLFYDPQPFINGTAHLSDID